MSAVGKYQALADCRAGGLFRRKGDVFEMPMLKKAPPHLKEIGASGSGKEDIGVGAPRPKTGKPASVPKDAQVGKEDIGVGAPRPAQDVTSADMVTK